MLVTEEVEESNREEMNGIRHIFDKELLKKVNKKNGGNQDGRNI